MRNRPHGRFLGGQTRLQLSAARVVVLGYGQSAAAMLDTAADTPPAPATLVAWRAGDQTVGTIPQGGSAIAQRFGDWTFGTAIGVASAQAIAGREPPRATHAIVRADRRFGTTQVGLAVMHSDEQGMLLGSHLSSVFGVRGSATSSILATTLLPFGNWSIMAAGQFALTRADLTGQGLVRNAGRFWATAGSLSLARTGAFADADRISLTIAQPLRASGLVTLATRPDAVRFGAGGREIAVEAGYALPVATGSLGLGGFWRHQPGHIAGAAPDAGVAAQMNLRF